MNTPLVRDEHGAILGIDWRQVPGMGLATVPGRIDARNLQPGDTVLIVGELMTVLSVHLPGASECTFHVTVRTDDGAKIVREFSVGDSADVVATGAFDR